MQILRDALRDRRIDEKMPANLRLFRPKIALLLAEIFPLHVNRQAERHAP